MNIYKNSISIILTVLFFGHNTKIGEMSIPFIQYQKDTCGNLDVCINDAVFLNDGKSMRKAFVGIRTAWKTDDRIYFMTKDSTKYISFGTNYGGGIDQYQDVTIGFIEGKASQFLPKEVKVFYANPFNREHYSTPAFHFTLSSFSDFKTKSGIQLGLSQKQFLLLTKSMKFSKSIKNGNVIYSYTNEYCMYYATYIFKADKLFNFSFGYINP
jgi:hypothetical protein